MISPYVVPRAGVQRVIDTAVDDHYLLATIFVTSMQNLAKDIKIKMMTNSYLAFKPPLQEQKNHFPFSLIQSVPPFQNSPFNYLAS